MAFADQTVQVSSLPLVAVPTVAPHAAVTVEAGGQAFNLLSPHGSVVTGLMESASTLAALQPRYHFYARDGRLMKVDLQPPSGTPQGSLLSSLATSDICSGSYISPRLAVDHAQPQRSYLLLTSPKPGQTCSTVTLATGVVDVQHRAVRMDMDGSAVALSVPEALVVLRASDGGIRGFIVRDGDQVRRTDADFANAQDLFTTPPGLISLGVFGSAAPGFWIYRASNTLHIVDLANPEQRGLVGLPQGTDLCMRQTLAVDGAGAYMACGRILLRIDASGGTQIGLAAANVTELSLTPTRVVFRAGNALASLPRAGGPITALGDAGILFSKQHRNGTSDGGLWQRSFLVGGENVYTAVSGGPAPTQRVNIVRADGSDAVQLAGAAIMNWTEPPQVPWVGHAATHTLYIVENQTAGGFPGAPVTAYDPATRTARFVLGNLATGLLVTPFTPALPPVVFGQPGLLRTLETNTALDHVLYLFNGSGPGLIPVAP